MHRGSIPRVSTSDLYPIKWTQKYVFSPLPGEEGSSIIDGHLDNGLGRAGVFKNLSSAKIGDIVEVVTYGGKKLSFNIIRVDTYNYLSTSTDAQIYPYAGSYLRLITCGGTWLPKYKTYDMRIIVTAKLVN